METNRIMSTTYGMPSTMTAIFMMFFLSSTSVVPVMTSPDMRPNCMEKCSDEVKCRVSYGRCFHVFTNSKSVASRPTGLKIKQTVNDQYKYVDLEWTPPDDGSFRDLKAFNIIAGFTSLDAKMPGDRGSQCYRLEITDPDWISRYSNMSVRFYLRCIRLMAQDYMTMRLSITSLPLNKERAKAIHREITIKPDGWNPRIKKWMDDKNYFHIRIQNPHPAASYYRVSIMKWRTTRPEMEFTEIFPAQHFETGDHPKRMTLPDVDNVPHYVIKNLSTEYNVSINVRALCMNKSEIPNTNIILRPFSLNMTKDVHKKVETTSPNVSRVDAMSKAEDRTKTQVWVAFLVVGPLVVLFVIAVCVCWNVKRCRRMASHSWRTCKLRVPHLATNTRDLPKIINLYCEEDEIFVGTVESHINLLQRYVNVLPVHEQMGPSQLCPCLNQGSFLFDSELKITNVVIYLSPGMGRLLRKENIQGLSRSDTLCYRNLQSLRRKRQFAIHIVTFDCFQQKEMDCLPLLNNMLAPNENFNTPDHATVRQRTVSSTPIKLAVFNQNSWRLENLDILLYRLFRMRDFPQDLPTGIAGWQESPEAKVVEQYLNRFGSRLSTKGDNSHSQSSLRVPASSDSATLDNLSETASARPSPRARHETNVKHIIDPGDPYGVEIDSAFTSHSSHAKESDCVSADDSGNFYSSGNFSDTPDTKLVVDMSGCNGHVTYYTHNKSDKHNGDILDHKINTNHDRHPIKPPLPAILYNDHHKLNGKTNIESESESDNEHFSSSLESDSLLTTEYIPLSKRDNKDKNSLRNHSSTAISPPSSLLHTLKDSISDLIAAQNTTMGWNGTSFA